MRLCDWPQSVHNSAVSAASKIIFHARQFEFVFPRPALVMGVVNVTPDSFSDGGKILDPAKAVAHALSWSRKARKFSTSAANPLAPGGTGRRNEELHRVIPVVEQLVSRVKIPLSIDTVKPTVARAHCRPAPASSTTWRPSAKTMRCGGLWRNLARLHLHARARHAANDANESGLCGRGSGSRRIFLAGG